MRATLCLRLRLFARPGALIAARLRPDLTPMRPYHAYALILADPLVIVRVIVPDWSVRYVRT